ncbi:MAG: hypothetical protein ACI8PZ_004991 [Myxococcota bacterium]|jgi:hypothetical protein
MGKRELLAGLAVLAATTLPYLSTLDNPLIWDSHSTVVDDPSIRSIAEIPGYFLTGSLPAEDGPERVAYWRPIPKALLALQYAVFGASPAGYHAVSVTLGALGVAAAGIATRVFTRDTTLALCAALLWGLAPARGEAIAWVYGQSTLLCALFMLGGLVAHHRDRPVGAIAAFSGALLCRESAVVLPLLVLVVDWAWGRGASLRRAAPTATLVVAWIVARSAVLGAAPPLTELSATGWLSTAPHVLVAATEAGFWPRGGVALHPLVTADAPTVRTALGAVLGTAWVVGAIALARSGRRDIAAWLLWAQIGVLPWLNIGRFADFLYTEKAMYLPSLGLAAAVATAGIRAHRIGLAAVLLLTVGLGLRTTWRTAHWADEETFLAAIVDSTPDYAPPVFLLAVNRAKSGDLAGAEPLFVRAAELSPRRAASAWLNAGNCRDGLGDGPGAEQAWRQALEHDPALAGALYNLATNAERRRDLPDALSLYQRFLAAEPAAPPALRQRVEALERYLAGQ